MRTQVGIKESLYQDNDWDANKKFIPSIVNHIFFLCKSKSSISAYGPSSSGTRSRLLPISIYQVCTQAAACISHDTRVSTNLLLLLRPSSSNFVEETTIIHPSDVLLLHSPILRPQQDIHGHPCRKSAPDVLHNPPRMLHSHSNKAPNHPNGSNTSLCPFI